MKVIINWVDGDRTLADVTSQPGWLMRLLGAVEFDRLAWIKSREAETRKT